MNSESAGDKHDGLDPLLFSAFVQMQAASRRRLSKLPEIDRIGLRKYAVDAELDGDRQRMSLKERETDRWLKIAVVTAAIAFTFLALLVAPWVIPPTGIAAVFGYLRHRAA